MILIDTTIIKLKTILQRTALMQCMNFTSSLFLPLIRLREDSEEEEKEERERRGGGEGAWGIVRSDSLDLVGGLHVHRCQVAALIRRARLCQLCKDKRSETTTPNRKETRKKAEEERRRKPFHFLLAANRTK